jgi:hypothetical protein
MKYIKTYEGKAKDYFSLDNIFEEINIIKDIVEFLKVNDLEIVDIWKDMTITLDEKGHLYKIVKPLMSGEPYLEEIMVGILRHQGLFVYNRILKHLNNMSDEDIEIERLKHNKEIKKYNL